MKIKLKSFVCFTSLITLLGSCVSLPPRPEEKICIVLDDSMGTCYSGNGPSTEDVRGYIAQDANTYERKEKYTDDLEKLLKAVCRRKPSLCRGEALKLGISTPH